MAKEEAVSKPSAGAARAAREIRKSCMYTIGDEATDSAATHLVEPRIAAIIDRETHAGELLEALRGCLPFVKALDAEHGIADGCPYCKTIEQAEAVIRRAEQGESK